MSKRNLKGYYDIPTDIIIKYPSVTTIQRILDKPALSQWRVDTGVDFLYDSSVGPFLAGDMSLEQLQAIDMPKLVADAKYYHQTIAHDAADFGSRLHAALDVYHKTIAWPVDPELREAFIKALQWEDEVYLKVIESELLVYSQTFRYAGTSDLLAEIRLPIVAKPLKGILDYKTYGKKDTIHKEWLQQLSAYVLAVEEMNGELLDFGGILTIHRDTGELKPHIYFRPELIQPGLEFIALANYYHIVRRGK